jgi:hypothetical protein
MNTRRRELGRQVIGKRAGVLVALFATLLAVAPSWAGPELRYDIRASLDTREKTITGMERIVYAHDADGPLDELYLHLYANAYRSEATTAGREAEEQHHDFTLAHTPLKDRGWVEIRSVSVNGRSVSHEVDETLMRIGLPEPAMPGEVLVLEIDFMTKIPRVPHRLQYSGSQFTCAQWYPKMALRDEDGWHKDKYHLVGEFHGEFATYDVRIELPGDYYVGATGHLVEAVGGDNDIPEASAAMRGEAGAGSSGSETTPSAERKTLAFHAERVHDFAWVASPDYVKDSAEWRGVTVTALVLRKDYSGEWENLLEYSLDSIEFYSDRVGMYPYSHLTVVEAASHPNGGMEYPMLSMLDPGLGNWLTKHRLEEVASHEIGHIWWYGIVANDEVQEPWLDEGINQYYTHQYLEWKYGDREWKGPGLVRTLQSLGGDAFSTRDGMIAFLGRGGLNQVIDQPAYHLGGMAEYGTIVYAKGSRVLEMLGAVVGDEVLDDIMRSFYDEYSFRHPSIEDFVRVAETVSGEELDWFFDQWLRTGKSCDSAAGGVSRSSWNESTGEYVTTAEVLREGEIVMPVEAEAILANGERVTETVFAEKEKSLVTFHTESPVEKVVVDPRHRLLEWDRMDNQSGFLPPVQWSGLFHGEQEREPPSAYPVRLNPTLAYNSVDRWRVGVSMGTPRVTLVPHRFLLSVDYGTASEKWNYRSLLVTTTGRNGELSLAASDAAGRRGVAFEWKTPSVVTRVANRARTEMPKKTTRISAGFRDRYNDRYEDPKWSSPGKTTLVEWVGTYENKGYHGFTQGRVEVGAGIDMLDPDYTFRRGWAEASQDLRLGRTGAVLFRFRGTAGLVTDGAPIQERMHVALGVPASTVNPVAFLSRHRGGGGVRGYQTEAAFGTNVLAAGVQLSSKRFSLGPVTPILFFDGGRVGGDGDSRLLDRVVYDAGPEFWIASVLNLSFPVWLSDPPVDEDEFDFRMVVKGNLAF